MSHYYQIKWRAPDDGRIAYAQEWTGSKQSLLEHLWNKKMEGWEITLPNGDYWFIPRENVSDVQIYETPAPGHK